VKRVRNQNAGNILADLRNIYFVNPPRSNPGVIRKPLAAKKPKTPSEPNLRIPTEKLK
jgi:hypothetical protein